MSNSIVNFAIRGAQIVFAAIVCGLSIDLARGHHWGGLPVILGYVAFVGCASLLGAFAGLASTWVEVLQGKIGLIIDGFITGANLAGGLLVAIKLKGVKCDRGGGGFDNSLEIIKNYLINGGTHGTIDDDVDITKYCYYCGQHGLTSDENTLISRCKKNQADSAFMFLTVIVLTVSITLTYLRMKKGY